MATPGTGTQALGTRPKDVEGGKEEFEKECQTAELGRRKTRTIGARNHQTQGRSTEISTAKSGLQGKIGSAGHVSSRRSVDRSLEGTVGDVQPRLASDTAVTGVPLYRTRRLQESIRKGARGHEGSKATTGTGTAGKGTGRVGTTQALFHLRE